MKNFKIKIAILLSLILFTACSNIPGGPYEKKSDFTWRKVNEETFINKRKRSQSHRYVWTCCNNDQ